MVKDFGVPLHEFDRGVTIIVALTCNAVALVAIKGAILPGVPEVIPMVALLVVQL
jgi:hypothetical protein